MPDDSTSSTTAVADNPALKASPPTTGGGVPSAAAVMPDAGYAHEESETVEIDIRELAQQQKDDAAAAAALAREQAAFQAFAAVPGQTQSPNAPPVATIPTAGPAMQGYASTPHSAPAAPAAQPMTPQQRQEMTPARQPVVSRYMLTPPTGQPAAVPASTAVPHPAPPIQSGSSPRTTASGFGSVARAAPDGLSAMPSQPPVSYVAAASPAPAAAVPLASPPTSAAAPAQTPVQPAAGAPAPLIIQPPSPELTPTVAATVNPLPLAPFPGTLEHATTPVVPAPQPRPVTEVLPGLRSRHARKIYSHNTKAVWAANTHMKLVNIIVWMMLATIMAALVGYWISIGSPTKLTDWPVVKLLLGI